MILREPNSFFSFILASKSPRRADLLREHGYHFKVRVSQAVEHMPCSRTVREKVIENARMKGEDVIAELSDQELHTEKPLVLCAADTLVVLGDQVYGKPTSYSEAKRMLNELAEKPHLVMTGLFLKLLNGGLEYGGVAETEVTLVKMSDSEMEALFYKSNPLDKAAGYGFQDAPEIVSNLKGSKTNVIGLPMELLHKVLRSWITDMG